MANVIGPDVSFYQDDPETPQGIDFATMRASANAKYVIIRAGQNLWPDRDFKGNWREAKLAGLPRGSYWFYDSRADPKRQAELWVQQFVGDFGELPLFADFEETYNGTFKGWKNWYTFLERLKELIPGKEIAIYTGYYYWIQNAPSSVFQASNLEYFHQYPLWIANYGATEPLVPKPWAKGEWQFWQFTDHGDGPLYGVESGNIDLNYFNGDLAAFRARFNISDTPPPEPVPGGKKYRVIATALKVRKGPGTTFEELGQVKFGEIVEEIGANADRTWLNIRNSNGSLIGWSFSGYLQSLTPEPPQEEKKWRRVTATSLIVREGPALTFNKLGSLSFGEIVEEIGLNPDGTWVNVRKSDGSLTGWSSSAYLQTVSTPPPDVPPETPPDNEDEKWYRVTTSSLKVREGPGLTYNSIGLVYFGEIVESIGANSDGTWLNIRNADGSLTGWSFSDYLQSVGKPSPEVPSPTVPVPDHNDKTWYRIISAAAVVLESPVTSARILGTVVKNDTVPALDQTTNPNWIKIQLLDGLTGWCEKKHVVVISDHRPASIQQKLFNGITYLRKDLVTPRPIVVHVLAIDMQTAKLNFLATPPSNSGNILCTRVTSRFLNEFKMHVAINGGYFNYLDPTFNPATYCPNGGDPVRPSGFAASRGKIYSNVKTDQPVFYIGPRNQIGINEPKGRIFNAVSGDRIVVENGKMVKNLASALPAPRTAIGANRVGRWLTFMVVDGRQDGYSEGVTFPELADLLISYGVYTGVNMDGGGSSTMVIKGVDGKARILNSPVDQNTPGKERAVANHLGAFVG